MAEPIRVNTKKYTQEGKVDIDGNIWDVRLPGTGTEMRFNQASRQSKLYFARLEIIDKKIEAGTVTEAELDKYEEYSAKYDEAEATIKQVFSSMFNDGTDNNSAVEKWIDKTPSVVMIKAFEDIRGQASEQPAETQTKA